MSKYYLFKYNDMIPFNIISFISGNYKLRKAFRKHELELLIVEHLDDGCYYYGQSLKSRLVLAFTFTLAKGHQYKGSAGTIIPPNNKSFIIVTPKEFNPGVIAHECMHVLEKIYFLNEIGLTNQGDEWQAHLLSSLVDICFKGFEKYLKKEGGKELGYYMITRDHPKGCKCS